jgi:prephenate dehydratase
MPPFGDFESEPRRQRETQSEPRPQRVAEAAPMRCAFQGEPGAFSEDAVIQLWRGAAEAVPKKTFEDVMDAVESGEVEFGMLPIESTLVGGVDSAYDLLIYHEPLFIAAETVVRIHLCVLAVPGAKLRGIRVMASHPLMLAQCAYFLDRHRHIVAQTAWDTAGAAREVMESGDPTRAAAAGESAAIRFGLETLAEGIEDRPDTQMRFLAVAAAPATLADGTPARTAALCTVKDVAGGLVAALQPLASYGFNVSHFAARPTREPWQYQYFIEWEHDAGDPRARAALDAVRAASATCRVLGTYPRWVEHVDSTRIGLL